jgi:hypothetical protein
VALCGIALVAFALSGCNRDQGPGEVKAPSDEGLFGACFSTIQPGALGVGMDAAGQVMTYLTTSRPTTVKDDQWLRDDRAMVMVDLATTPIQYRHFLLPWAAPDEFPVMATTKPGAKSTARPYQLVEQMITMQQAEKGGRFAVGVRRQGVEGLIAKVYSGIVPTFASNDVLALEHGLELVPVNDYVNTEGIRSFDLSPDGSKLAAVVGNQGEVRVYDFTTNQLSVYTLGPTNKVVVSNELPKLSSVSLDAQRRPAVANQGSMNVTWSPQGDRLAIATDLPVNDSALAIMNPADGKLTPVRRFKESTVPQVAWAADGQSLYIMTTDLENGPVFGNTAIRHIAAAEGGKDLAKGGQLLQPQGFTSEPANLVNFGDDGHFLFTWQGGLWRLALTGDDLTTAKAEKVSPPDAVVPYTRPVVSQAIDKAAFIAGSGSSQYVTLRDEVSSNSCAAGTAGEALPTPTPAPEGTAGTAPAATSATSAATAASSGTAAATAGATAAATSEGGTASASPAATAAAASPEPTK